MSYINGTQILDGVTITGLVNIDTEMSDTSENPVQNKVVKQYVDNNAGMRLINSISVPDGETATMLKIDKDTNGAGFSLNHIMFAIRLNLSEAKTVTIRLRTNGGARYLFLKSSVAANTILFISGESKVFSLGTNTQAEYTTANADTIGTMNGNYVCAFASNEICKTNISDIEIFLFAQGNQFVPLQAGSSVELWGC